MTKKRQDSEKITVYLTPNLKRELQSIAEANERTVSAEANVALAGYVLRKLGVRT